MYGKQFLERNTPKRQFKYPRHRKSEEASDRSWLVKRGQDKGKPPEKGRKAEISRVLPFGEIARHIRSNKRELSTSSSTRFIEKLSNIVLVWRFE